MGRPGVIPVFVGNISFDTTEEMVREVFAEVGPVVAVRLVNSKDSGKPKGYGFVEFGDMATAESAVRNLNGRDLAGRALRVDFAEHPDGSRVVVGTRRGALSLAAPQLGLCLRGLRRRHPHCAARSSRRSVGNNRSGAAKKRLFACALPELLCATPRSLLVCQRCRPLPPRWRPRTARLRLARPAVRRPVRLPTCSRCGCRTCRHARCTRLWRRPKRWRPRILAKRELC